MVALTVGQDPSAVATGLRLLKANSGDDAAERVSRALDGDDIVNGLQPADWILLGESNRGHRHYDRAVAQLEKALAAGAGKRADLLYSIGRAHFGAEQYEAAERRYLEGAAMPGTAEDRGNFFYNAARSAQLAGDDGRAEKHLADAIRAGGKTSRASSALTQRIRLRVKQGKHAAAKADLATVRKLFAKSHALVEASLAYATATIAAGKNAEALSTLNAIPKRLLEKADVPEVDYWKARALEATNPAAAVRAYLDVLQANTPTHFAYFARRRMAQAPLSGRLAAEAAAREARATELAAKGDDEGARKAQTEAVLLSAPADAARRREKLVEIYRRLPKYQAILEAPPPTYPKLPLFGSGAVEEPKRLDLLLALGLYDDAAEDVIAAYPLQPLESGIARSEALAPRPGRARLDLRHRVRAAAPRGLPARAAPAPGARAAVPALLLRRHRRGGAEARRRPAARPVDHARGVALQPPREVTRGGARAAAVHHHHRARRRAARSASSTWRPRTCTTRTSSSSSARGTSATC